MKGRRPFDLTPGAEAATVALAKIAAERNQRDLVGADATTASIGNDGKSVVLVMQAPCDFVEFTPEGAIEAAQLLVGQAIAVKPELAEVIFQPQAGTPAPDSTIEYVASVDPAEQPSEPAADPAAIPVTKVH